MTRIGVWLPHHEPTMAPEYARLAEDLGYVSAWQSEGRHGDQFSVLTACALATNRILLGTNISSVFVRTAPLVGMAAATVDQFSNGRFILGLGSDHRAQIVPMHGMPFEKPIPRLIDTVAIVRQLWRDRNIAYSGEALTIERYDLFFHPTRPEIPIYIGGVFPKMLGIAGEISNGVIAVNHTADSMRQVRETVLAGAAKAGKRPEDVTIALMLPCAIADDPAEARARMRKHVATPTAVRMPRYAKLKDELGFGEEWSAMVDALNDGDKPKAMSIISDRYLDAFTVTGTAADGRARIDALRDAGVDLVILGPIGEQAEVVASMRAMAPVLAGQAA